MMPIEPATETMAVRLRLDSRFLRESENDIVNGIAERLRLPFFFLSSLSSFLVSSFCGAGPIVKGRLSPITAPSRRFIIRVEYLLARSGLCVTIMTRRSREISFRSSIICTLVLESSAPVGSSASTISGSFMRARAIATLCAWPPESWLGRLCILSLRPTLSRASIALLLRSRLETPEIISASSTFCNTVWWGMR